MSGRFSGLKDLQQSEEPAGETLMAVPAPLPNLPVEPVRPWEALTTPTEPVKALNGRVPRSVRLAFDRQMTDAMDVLGTDVTVDLAVEALARLVTEDTEVRERWLHKLWSLKRP